MGKNKYINTIVILILFSSFFVSIFPLFLQYKEIFNDEPHLLNEEILFSDFYWHYNTIKYVANHCVLPYDVPCDSDGGYDGSKSDLEAPRKRLGWNNPLYYYLAAPAYLLALNLKFDPILSLHVFSVILNLFTNILFYFFLRNLYLGKKFILYALSIFAFLPTHLFISLGIHNDVSFYLLFIFSLYTFSIFYKKRNLKSALLFGIAVGFTLLSKLSGIILTLAMIVYILLLYFKKEFSFRNKFILSFLISILFGSFPLIRNKLLFNNFLGDQTFVTKSFYLWFKMFKVFWAGVDGGNSDLYFLIATSAILLTLFSIWGVFLIYKKKKLMVSGFLLICAFITIFLALHFACNFLKILTMNQCIGRAVQNRFLIPLEPSVAVFSAVTLVRLSKQKYLNKPILLFIITISSLFVIDFIYAFI